MYSLLFSGISAKRHHPWRGDEKLTHKPSSYTPSTPGTPYTPVTPVTPVSPVTMATPAHQPLHIKTEPKQYTESDSCMMEFNPRPGNQVNIKQNIDIKKL